MLHHNTLNLAAVAFVGSLIVGGAQAQVCNHVAEAELLGGQTAGLRGVPVLGYDGSPIVGRPFALRVTNGKPNSIAVIAAGAAHTPLALGSLGATFHPAGPFISLLTVATDDNGATPGAAASSVLAPAFCGFEFYAQAVVVDAEAMGGLAVTAGMRLVIGLPNAEPHQLFAPKEIGLSGPIAVTSGDFDRDGFADLAIADAHAGEVAVLLGRGDDRFHDRVGFAVGAFPHAIVAADFNDDGRVDLATANYQDPGLSILIGDGAGSFASATNFQLLAPARDLDVGDLDGDGAIDIVVGLYDFGVHVNSGVAVFRGDGAGGFVQTATLPTVELVFQVALSDVNGDGALDIVALTSGLVRVYPGNGDGTLGAPTDHATGSSPFGLAIADLNGDGISDIVVCSVSLNTVATMIATPGGGFTVVPTAASISSPQAIVVGDVSGDGVPDAVTANNNGTFTVAFGDGMGHFVTNDSFDAGALPSGLVLVDLDGNGMRDVVVVNFSSNDITAVLNRLVD